MICITTFFNPNGSPLRKRNYQTFRSNLPYPLIVVEFSNTGSFEISPDANTVHIKVTKGDRLWQKERLLNIGIEHAMREGHRKVVCLDCDIVFEDPNWFEQVDKALDDHDVVQCFSDVAYLSAEASQKKHLRDLQKTSPIFVLPSAVEKLTSNKSFFKNDLIDVGQGIKITGIAGIAWAYNIGNGHPILYEKCIVGGGDLILLSMVFDKLDELFCYRKLTQHHECDIRNFSQMNYMAQKSVSFVVGRIYHLWHGDFSDRLYADRWLALIEGEYNPELHVYYTDGNGLEFTPEADGLREVVNRYFNTRKDQ